MPKIINSLNSAEVDGMTSFINNNRGNSVKICEHHELDVFCVAGSGFEIFYACWREKPEIVLYASKVRKIEQHVELVPQGFAGRQVLIKKFSNSGIRKISSFIFWEVIFQKYGVVISDSEQTFDGRGFWEHRLGEAFERGHVVRLLNTESRQVKVLNNVSELQKLMLNNEIWDSRNWFTRIILSVSKE